MSRAAVNRNLGIPYRLTPADAKAARTRAGGRCTCCGTPARLELDRVVPSLGYVPSNINMLCAPCNRAKSDATLEQLRLLVQYVETHNKERHARMAIAESTNNTRRVALYLRKHGHISPAQAQTVFGIGRLAPRICELNKLGEKYSTGEFVVSTRRVDDGGKVYCRYVLYTAIPPSAQKLLPAEAASLS